MLVELILEVFIWFVIAVLVAPVSIVIYIVAKIRGIKDARLW